MVGVVSVQGLKPLPPYWSKRFDCFILTISFKPLLTEPYLHICEANTSIVSVFKFYFDDMKVHLNNQLLTRVKIRSTEVLSSDFGKSKISYTSSVGQIKI